MDEQQIPLPGFFEVEILTKKIEKEIRRYGFQSAVELTNAIKITRSCPRAAYLEDLQRKIVSLRTKLEGGDRYSYVTKRSLKERLEWAEAQVRNASRAKQARDNLNKVPQDLINQLNKLTKQGGKRE